MVLSLFCVYKTQKNQRDHHPLTEKTVDYPKKREMTTRVIEVSPPRHQRIKRAGAPTHFEFPAKTAAAPRRPSLRISHPYPIQTNEPSESIAFPARQDSPTSISVSPHTRHWADRSVSNPTPPRTPTRTPPPRSPRTPRKSFSSSIPAGRKSSDSAASPHRQHIRKSSAPNLPTRPESRPVMPPAAFWKYAIDRQSVDTSPGILQSWQLAGDRRSLPSSVGQLPPLPPLPKSPTIRSITPSDRPKSRGDKTPRKRSLDSVDRRSFHRQVEGPSTELIDGITWEIAGSPMVQPRGRDRQSRKLVKKRRPSGP